MANGHPEARFYPLGMVWEEAELVVERTNREEASRSVLMQSTIASVLTKEGGKAFKKIIKELLDDG